MGEEASCDDSVADGEGRSVVVVGGGPAGLEASMILAKRNFHVVLFEKRERLGGQMYLASLPPHRAKMGNFILYAEKQLKDLGVEIHLNEEATADKIRALSPYAVFLTTGSVPVLPRSIPGIDRPNVYVAEDVLTERVRFSGRKIAVIGGGLTGMETAEYLQTGGNEVFEVEMVDAMGAVGFPLMIMDATSSLAKLGVRTVPGHKLLEIRENSILLEDNAGYRIEEACDAVIVALGARAQNTLEEALKPDMKVFTAGDAKRGGRRIPDAIHEAFQVALLL
jgi:NADPH-dependent 2,4-dienoyl-CoA reductase/sulfur reductase-like enzyme